ncbi:MAG: hypothetical protein ABIT01_00815 [Thermoanaerobaculia bacterium]
MPFRNHIAMPKHHYDNANFRSMLEALTDELTELVELGEPEAALRDTVRAWTKQLLFEATSWITEEARRTRTAPDDL